MDNSQKYSGIQTDAIRADGLLFNDTDRMVYEFPLQGIQATVADGVQTAPLRMVATSNRNILRQINEARGGSCDAIALGVMFKIQYNVDITSDAGLPVGFRATNSLQERLALSTLQVIPGKAGEGYFMSNGETSIGQFLEWAQTSGGFRQQFQAAFMACDDYNLTQERGSTLSQGFVATSQDNVANDMARALMPHDIRRVCALGPDAGGPASVSLPEFGTPQADLVYFPLTLDGPTGVTSAGFGSESFFSSENEWIFYLRPKFDAEQYAGTATLVGDFTITASLIYRIHVGKKQEGDVPVPPAHGATWRWVRQAGTIPDGTSTIISGGNVVSHVCVGYPTQVYGDGNSVPKVDGNNFFWQELSPGTNVAVKRRLVPPMLVPSDLNTPAQYLIIGREGGLDTFPLGGYNQALGNESLKELNWRSRNAAAKNALGLATEAIEYPIFSDYGVRNLGTSFVVFGDPATAVANPPLRFGASWGAGAAVQATVLNRGDLDLPTGLGGLRNFLLAWCDRTVEGFAGVQVRSDSDMAGLRVLTVGTFRLPKRTYTALNQGVPAQVNVITRMGPYEAFSSDPCSCDHDQFVPLVYSPGSKASEKGASLTSSFKVLEPTVMERTSVSRKK